MLKSNISVEKKIPDVAEDVLKKKITTREIEKWEVVQLNCNLEPRSKPTHLFEKLEEKRRVRHENLLIQLAKNLHDLNMKTEKNVKISSEELKAHVKDFEDRLEKMLTAIDTPEIASKPSSVFTEYQNIANEYKSQQSKLVNELHEDLIKFEGERAVENEKLLRQTCGEMIKIAYFLPSEVQAFVEHETLKMNQLSLNNRRCYEDLKLTLTLVTEQTYKSFMDKVFCIREKWIQFKLHETFCNLQNKAEKDIVRLLPEAYRRLEMKGQELILQHKPNYLYNTCKAEEWSKNVQKIVAVIDTYGKNLIDIYKKTINAVYQGFNGEVEEIKSELNLVESLTFEERVIKPIVFEVQNDQIKEIEELEVFWQETLENVQKYVKDLTQFLLDAGKLWDRHTERICESKKLILKALEKAENNNQEVLEDLEIKLNMNLDVLRQEHNQGKLEKAYEDVLALLNSLKAKYESMYLEDVSIIEDFYKMMNLEADVLSAEIKEFIYEIHAVESGKSVHFYSDQQLQSQYEKLLVKEIQACAMQIQTIRNWKQGFLGRSNLNKVHYILGYYTASNNEYWSTFRQLHQLLPSSGLKKIKENLKKQLEHVWVAFESLSDNTREILHPRAESWINEKIENLAETKSIQLELLEKRFQRIRIEMYEKRLAEIESHQKTLENHKEKVNFELAKMKEDLKSLVTEELSKMNLVEEYLTDMETNGMREDRPGVIRGNQLMMTRKKSELENELKMTLARLRAECETKVMDIKEDNMSFIKSIKLFHENGNYSAEEGKTFISELETVDKKINTELKNILRDSAKEENDLIKKLSAIFSPSIALFTSLYEETLFNFEVQLRLQNFISGIQDGARRLKLDLDFLKSQCYFLCKSVKNAQDALNNIDDNFWNFTFHLLYKNVSNLLYPITVPETPRPSVLSEEAGEGSEEQASTTETYCCAGKFSVHFVNSNTFTFRTTEKDDVLSCKDYKNQFFNCEKPPENDGTFLTVMCNYFWTEMDFFQKAACNFYKRVQGRKIIRDDLISSSYDIFISEIMLKFKYYNTQIEQFWFQMLIEFLILLGSLKSLANEFLERKLHEYEVLAFKVLDDLRENISSCLTSLILKNSKEREHLENRLLPLHGYPDNSNLLKELEEEVVLKISNQEINLESAVKYLKKQLSCFSVKYIQKKSEIEQIEIIYLKLRDRIFVENLGDKLLDTILDYCEKEELYIKKTLSDSLIFKKDEGSRLGKKKVPEEFELSFESVDENKPSRKTCARQLKQIIERERVLDIAPSPSPPCSGESFESVKDEEFCVKLCEPKLNILMKLLNFEERVHAIEENLKNSVRQMKNLAHSQTNSHEEEIFKWLNKWKVNVKNVLKLYRVKYEEKPEAKEIIQVGE